MVRKKSIAPPTNAREAAFLAVYQFLKYGIYAEDTLGPLALKDIAQARHIAYGTIQRLLSLDFIARQLAKRPSLSLKPQEKALLFTALYQAHFQQGAPLYAVTNEMTKLSRQYCHSTFVSFLNAVLRAYGQQCVELPKGESAKELSIRYSYPEWFVQQLCKEQGISSAKQVLELGNHATPTLARHRTAKSPFTVVPVTDIESISTSADYYIQNATPVHLAQALAKATRDVKRALDLCAAPGGKLILAHDIFPNAQLFANDVSEQRLSLLRQNLQKYNIYAEVSCGEAKKYASTQPFDLVILDVPCSNTGVLGKRPEARWRLSQAFLQEQQNTQRELLQTAVNLLAPHGVIWYLTCSILKDENENLVNDMCASLNLETVSGPMTVLPNSEGWDGGFGVALKKRAK